MSADSLMLTIFGATQKWRTESNCAIKGVKDGAPAGAQVYVLKHFFYQDIVPLEQEFIIRNSSYYSRRVESC